MSTIAVPISSRTFLDLADFLNEKRSSLDPVDVVETAISYWIDNADWKPELLGSPDQQTGYSWKSLFLPSGTNLRIKINGEYVYAKVEGDRIVYNGQSVSPNQFALKAAGCARDAWRDVWIRRPTDRDYAVADSFR